jgi:hypothetical protein
MMVLVAAFLAAGYSSFRATVAHQQVQGLATQEESRELAFSTKMTCLGHQFGGIQGEE